MGDSGTGLVIENDATVKVNGEAEGLTSDKVDTRWGNIQFTKQAEKDKAPLQDVEFRVYTNKTDADAGLPSNAILNTGTTTLKSATTGEVTLNALRASNWVDGKEVSAGTVVDGECVLNVDENSGLPVYNVYWITEVKAAENYELLAKPVPVVLESSPDGSTFAQKSLALDESGDIVLKQDAGEGVDTCSYEVSAAAFGTIQNVEKNAGFNLPLTGGWGTIWLMVAGGTLLAIVLMVARRRRAEEV